MAINFGNGYPAMNGMNAMNGNMYSQKMMGSVPLYFENKYGCEDCFRDKPSKEVLEEYTQVNVAAKSAQAVIEYQNDYKARRDAYESGEDVPPYLDKEFFTSTAKGIGQGALDNTNMTNDEKAKFISDWKDDAKKYDDYKDVTQNIDEKLENNPEYKEIASKVKTISEEKAHAKSTNIPKDDVPQSEITKKSRETESVVTPPSASTPHSDVSTTQLYTHIN